MSDVKSLITENNRLREKLTIESKDYYEKILIYIRSAGLFYDDYEVETLLFQILQDMLMAQGDGISAEDYFGKAPQDAADELIQNLEKVSVKSASKMVGLIFGISSFFSLISALTAADMTLNILVLIFNGLLSILFVGVIFFALHKSTYKNFLGNKTLSFIVLWLVCCLIIGLLIIVALFTPPILTLSISNPLGILIISILSIGSTYWILFHKKEVKKEWSPCLPFIWIMGGIGISMRLPQTEKWMTSDNGTIAIIILTVFGTLLYYVLMFIHFKKKK